MGKTRLIENRLENVRFLAKVYGWMEVCHQRGAMMVSFRRSHVRLNVYYSTLTVVTSMKHPARGYTQLSRRNLDMDTIEKILYEPRVHTDKGRYQRKTA